MLTARRMDRLKVLEQELLQAFPSIKIKSLQLDVQDSLMVNQAIDSLDYPFNEIDVLVNNAG